MDWIQTVVLALIQGLTEFLPISSSAHLILPSQLLGWEDQGLAFDVGVHVGSLAAVVFYFRDDVARMLCAFFASFRGQKSIDGNIAWLVIFATVPAMVFGFLMNDIIDHYGRSMLVIAGTTIIFGAVLWWADAKRTEVKALSAITFKEAMLIGVAQAIALIPGTSRSGITMSAGLMLGFDRQSAARFSFLLSIPAISAAGAYKALELVQTATPAQWEFVAGGVVLSGLSALACIHLFLKWLDQVGMLPFVIYRFALGILLLCVYFMVPAI
ncbi:undecaprenyl-diphosphate phosphatase [Neptunomonas marina]|uniref:Undecaprenyl-diphosphatase n=1 Tax=Neptunomonas marina TaxID=1815562 RepID=A0A437Q7N1_9GAMM|nr:undecaprenyl-diphosphate phosphatase [Neptunomonas marina]RVU30393.1 undecaprenyl-diphosphate phosphatase [Neptunomonas marina]